MTNPTLAALEKAESFIAGFEGDEMQEGIDDLLEELRALIATPAPGMDDRLSSYDYELLADALDVLDPDGSEQTNRKSELEAWARAMAATGTGYLPEAVPGRTAPPIRVLVALEGGTVQGAVADREGVAVTVLDYDDEGADADRVYAIPQGSGGFASAWVAEHDATPDAAFIDAALAAELDDPEGALAELRAEAERWSKDEHEAIRFLVVEAAAKADALEARLPAALAAKAERERQAEERVEQLRQDFAARVAARAEEGAGERAVTA